MDYTFRTELQRLSDEGNFDALYDYYTKKYDENPNEYTKYDYKRYLILGALECEKYLQFEQSKCKYYRFAHSTICGGINHKDSCRVKYCLPLVYEDLGKVDFEFGINKAKNKNLWFNRAINHYKKAFELGNKNVEIYYHVANAYQELDLKEAAVTWYDKAIEKDDSYYNAYTCKAHILYDLGEYDRAIQTWYDLKNRFNEEDEADFYWVIGNNYKAKGEYEEAINTYKKGIECALASKDIRDRSFASFLTDLIADIYEEKKDYNKVIKVYLNSLKYGSDLKTMFYERLADFYSRIQDKDNAVKYWHILIKCRSRDYDYNKCIACKNLAWHYFNNKDLKHALYYSTKGIKLYWEWFNDYTTYKNMKEAQKDSADIINDLVDLLICRSNTLFDLKKNKEAINEYKNLLKYITYMEGSYNDWLETTISNTNLHIGLCYFILNKLNQAQKYLCKTNHPYYYLCKAEIAYRNKKEKSVKRYYKKFLELVNEKPQFDEDDYKTFTFLQTL